MAPISRVQAMKYLPFRIATFVAVGSVCFVLQYGLVEMFSVYVPLVVAEILGFMLSAQLNYVLSRTFTWADRNMTENVGGVSTRGGRWLRFNLSALASVFIVNATVFALLIHLGSAQWLAILVANIASAVFTFAMNHFVVFPYRPLAVDQMPADGLQPVSSVAMFMPAHNEAENLPEVIRHAHGYFNNAGIATRSVIVVDDGSTDSTRAVLDGLQQTFPVTVVSHSVNRGYGAALRSGIEAALDTGHEWIAFCDSDGQFNPEDLSLLFDAAREHGTYVALGYRADRADNWRRRTAGRAWHAVSQSFLGFRVTDVDCGFKLFHRQALLSVVPALRGDYATISPELLARLHHAGYRFAEVAVPHYARNFGRQSGLDIRVVMGSFVGLYPIRRELAAKVGR